ncbi:pectinesterase family protein [Flammeovirgaceae bacterium SG7u.111]|nr:pectinesterase family protein [Flammeovirgaceae bacterium SG7u.132]WPO33746.1 pectinesterase family protein [Flammeovirgaceae bacterium SG7u.111]
MKTSKNKTLLTLTLLLLGIGFGYAQPKVYPNKFTVAKDGSGDFPTIQEAINAVRDHSEQKVVIHIKNGTYQEKVVVPSEKRNIAFVGEDIDKTIISFNDYSGKERLYKDRRGFDKFTTYNSYTLLVQGNDFTAENLTIQNTAGRVGQAVAVHVEADRVAFKNCKILANQDTLYVSKDGTRNFFTNCYIEGTTDFIFGAATTFFEECTIVSKKNSFVTAASTRDVQPYGFIFLNCKLLRQGDLVNKVYLGRPWRPYAKTVFINTEMDEHILKEGWDNWRNPENEKTVFYAEYNSKYINGKSDFSQRVSWSKQLSKKDIKQFEYETVMGGWYPSFYQQD